MDCPGKAGPGGILVARGGPRRQAAPMEQLRMSGSIASYDQLVKQVEALKKENTHLRRELEDNSNHLSKLENETSDMKEVLKHLQGKLEQEAKVMVSSGQMEVLDQLKALQMDITSLYNLKFQPPALVPEPMMCQGDSPEGSPAHSATLQRKDSMGDLSRATIRLLEELDRERCFLLSEIEKEEKEKFWYYTQLQSLSKRLDELPHVETFSMQMDLIRQQLEFEAQHIRTLMEERFGTTDEMVQRAQIRASRLEQIDKELMEAQDKVQQSEPQFCGKLPGMERDGSLEVPTHPEEAGNHPGNSKVEVVFWLLSMLATRDKEDMSRTLLAMSSSQESCLAMRKSGCLPLLIQILHDTDREPGASESPAGREGAGKDSRMRANAALHNIIFSQPDEGQAKKEMRVLHVLEQIRSYSETCWDWLKMHSPEGAKTPDRGTAPVPIEPQICQATCAIMKLSFDEEYRRAMNELGGLQAIAELLQVDYEMHRMTSDPLNLALRRYTGMALTNLTFGDVVNKATLCSRRRCMQAIVAQLASDSEELHQVVSSILRNLSWRADINSKKVLREVGSVTALMQCALRAAKESTLKSVLSALWNLSAHSTENKAAICVVEGALGFLVSTLTYKCQSNSLSIIESGGGILRNVSSLIATKEDYRQVLRDHSCLQTLLQHLKSHSLTIVSNACGTLWNLSARSSKDQELLWDLGAVSMLRNLVHSKHKMIAMGSAAALRNLLANRPLKYKDAMVISPGSCMPSLYMRKQKALEAELDAKHLAETFDTMEKQTLKGQSAKKPTRHMDSLVKDYASDSGCFDDDEVPNVSSGGAETGNASVLSMFLNSSFLQGQALPRAIAQRRGPEPEKDKSCKLPEAKKAPLPLPTADNDVSMAAEKLANKISTTVAKIDKLVEDISTLHTSSDDSFSLSSEDHGLDWQCGSDEVHEARAQSCSPCRLSDTSGFVEREGLSRAHTLLRLKTAYTSLSNDSLNSGSTSDGYCTKEHMKPCTRTTFLDFKDELHRYQKRPSRLDLKNILINRPEKMEPPGRRPSEAGERAESLEKAKKTAVSPDAAEKESCYKKDPSHKLASDPKVHTIKLSPSYQHVPFVASVDNSSSAPTGLSGAMSHYPGLLGQKQDWLASRVAQAVETLNKIPEKLPVPVLPPAPTEQEQLQKYLVEDTPICFSRCSSLSSLSSADNGLDGQSHSENEMDSDSSLEIIEVEEVAEAEEAEKEEQGKAKMEVETAPPISQPIAIPFPKKEKIFLRGVSPSRHEDLTPSSSSENYIQETPLVMSRCSSVSSLGSFESPSIASSIQSEPCSEMISGTVSPSELPDSPGQTMPPSRSKTPLFELSGQLEKETSQFNIQWENNVKKFMEITDFKERFQMPQDLDSMVYFTVEKPNENFSCASSLSALPLHEHYVQKDVELKLLPPFPDRSGLNFVMHDEERASESQRKPERLELTSDEDIEILKECINSAMPSRFRKVRTSLVSGLPGQVLNPQSKKPVHVPVYMLVPANSHLGISTHRLAPAPRTNKNYTGDEDSFTDSAEGTPVNFSSTTSLSDETLHYPMKEEVDSKHCSAKQREMTGPRGAGHKMEAMLHEQGSLRPGRITSSHSTPTKMVSSYKHKTGSNHTSPLRAGRAQSAESKRGRVPLKNLELTLMRHGSGGACSEGSHSRKGTSRESSGHGSDMAFQSLCHTTPTEEAVYCFYENDSDDVTQRAVKNSPKRKAGGFGKGQKKECRAKKEPDRSARQLSQAKTKMAARLCSNLIVDETPPCYSLSSSVSSLSDLELYEHTERAAQLYSRANRQLTLNRRQEMKAALAKGRDSSASSLSYNSDDDLLQKCIGMAVPKRRRHATRRRNAEKEKKGSNVKEWKPEVVPDEIASERGSDLDSVEWKAIQEGANSIVTWLHQATSSFTKEPSSESDSILSFVSGLSVGSTLQLPLDRKERRQGKKVPGGHLEKKDHPKAFPEGKKLAEARVAGSRNSKMEKNPGQQKPVTNLPVVFRGRTVIYMPSVAKDPQSPRSTPKKTEPVVKQEAPGKTLSLNPQRSRSLHRLGKISEMADLTLPKRSATPPARISKPPSSGSSRTSAPSQPSQKKLTSPSQLNKQITSPREAGKASGSSTPSPNPKPVQRSPVSKQHKTQKSPVRIPFMQKPNKKPMPMRSTMPVLEEQGGRGGGSSGSEAKPKSSGAKSVLQSSRLNLVRMSSARSVGSESDRSGFLRQLTFIKESSSLIMRHRAELSSSEPISSSRSQGASPRRSRLGLPTVFLCSSRCDELKVNKPAGPSQRPVISRVPLPSQRAPPGMRPPRRTSSESPSRLPMKTSPVASESFKRYPSSPQINIIKRASSPTPTPSPCPESLGGRKGSEEASRLPVIPPLGAPEKRGEEQQPGTVKGTWKRIRDEDIPHILKSTLPSTALPLVCTLEEEESQKGLQRKTSDAVVQTEDFSMAKTNSSTSPTLEVQEAPKIPPDGCEADGFKAAAVPISFAHEGPVGSHGNFPHSRHSSPSRAARVTPFNYIPSPMVVSEVHAQQLEKMQA
ncbi:adenomatous polyposis coli protein 2 isoform X2 [Hemicordylus capensis]|uniref:adenomatous polyposis coli protein 2 isoform X2 n=1 Tax=Hemicordylus capensis TaxID=884348 RepID=UPI002304A08A|nr:adenomatous polyposis coli protein 2 isoform X2 [Hemicordylus capensis]